MSRVYHFVVGSALALLLGSSAFGMEDYGDTYATSWFIAVEGGQWQILGSGRDFVRDAPMVYLTTGFSLSDEFNASSDFEPLKFGPKIGFGVGEPRTTPADVTLFYDLLLKIRYTFGTEESRFRPYLDGGPGYINYEDGAFELEGGGGLEFWFSGNSLGVNVQYKELFGGGKLERGVVILGSLGHHF